FTSTSTCLRRLLSPSALHEKKNWSTEMSSKVVMRLNLLSLGWCPLFSIYIIERGVRSTSWARYSCVHPFASRAFFIAIPNGLKSSFLSSWYILISSYIIVHFG